MGGRSLIQILALYGAGSWLVLQVVDVLTDNMGLPDWVFPFALILLLIGLPIILTTAAVQRRMAVASTGAAQVTESAPESRASEDVRRLFTWRNALVGGGLAFVMLAIVTGGFMYMRNAGIGPVGSLVASGLLEDRAPIVIAEFESPDASIGAAATEALRIDLAQSDIVEVVEPAALVGAMERMQRDPSEPLTFEVAREVAVREGYPAVITGEIQMVGNGYTLSARIVDAGSGQTLASHRESAKDADAIIPAIDRLSSKMRERIGESYSDLRADAPLDEVTTASLEALEKYTESIAIFDRGGDTDLMNDLLEEAVAIDPGFAMAWRKLGLTRDTRSGRIEALENAYEGRDRLSDRERLLTEAAYHERVRRDFQPAINAYERLIEMDPNDTWALNNLGVIYDQDLGQHEVAYDYYRKALERDSTTAVHLRNVARTEINLGMYEEAREHLEQATERFPTDDVVVRLWVSLAASQQDFEAVAAAAERFRDLPSDPRNDMARLATLSDVALVHGRLREAERLAEESAREHERAGFPDPRRSMLSGLVWADANVRRDPEAAARRLESLLLAEPLDADDPVNRNYIGTAFQWARLGDRARAEALLAEFEAEVPEEYRTDVSNPYLGIEGLLLMHEGRFEDAIETLRRREDRGCVLCEFVPVAAAFDSLGMRDSAIAYYEGYVDADWHNRLNFDDDTLAPTLERLGQLHDEAGDLEEAAIYYARFVELWDEADPELQPRVAAARARLEEILRERG
ncbi:MAG: tetratricopeptide repeat protein [marine benthic group bacterium]|nr:tetratricopeptide repeat protein [Gemmatimonadota bacterium]